MAIRVLPELRFLKPPKPRAEIKAERVELIPLQECFIGPLPLRFKRPTAEILAERLAESGPDGSPLLFIP